MTSPKFGPVTSTNEPDVRDDSSKQEQEKLRVANREYLFSLKVRHIYFFLATARPSASICFLLFQSYIRDSLNHDNIITYRYYLNFSGI